MDEENQETTDGLEEMPAVDEPTTIILEDDPDLAEWQHDRIIIHRAVIRDILHLEDKDKADMLFLYCFYYEQGRRQKTNQPWATDTFTMKGTGWGPHRFYRIKKKLLSGGFIEVVVKKDDKGKVTKWYTKINYMSHTSQNSKSGQEPRLADSPVVEERQTNALRHQEEMLKDSNSSSTALFQETFDCTIPEDVLPNPQLDRVIDYMVEYKNPATVTSPVGLLIHLLKNPDSIPERDPDPRGVEKQREQAARRKLNMEQAARDREKQLNDPEQVQKVHEMVTGVCGG